MKKILILPFLVLLLAGGCTEEKQPEIQKAKEIELPHSTYLELVEVEGHEYIVVTKSFRGSGVAIIHSLSCPCQERR